MKKALMKCFYQLKPFIPRGVQLALRRGFVRLIHGRKRDVWPIDEKASDPPPGWKGWPEGKRFALILTHDVDTAQGQGKCVALARMEEALGFRSSFNFVPRRYQVSSSLREFLTGRGFEVGVHGLYHDGKYFDSNEVWRERASLINQYLKDWNAVGYRTPSMLHELDRFHDLDIRYDASTFDTDPFEPNADAAKTIFPFWVPSETSRRGGYLELPYTLPQDFTVFILLREKTIDLWKRKLDWIVNKGGMALVNSHPDYMNFSGGTLSREEYPATIYRDFLEYVAKTYGGQYWHGLPRETCDHWDILKGDSSRRARDTESPS